MKLLYVFLFVSQLYTADSYFIVKLPNGECLIHNSYIELNENLLWTIWIRGQEKGLKWTEPDNVWKIYEELRSKHTQIIHVEILTYSENILNFFEISNPIPNASTIQSTSTQYKVSIKYWKDY